METVLTSQTVSVTELKRNFAHVLQATQEAPIAVLNHNKPEAYLISAAHYAHLLEVAEDAADRAVVAERQNGPFVPVDIDAL